MEAGILGAHHKIVMPSNIMKDVIAVCHSTHLEIRRTTVTVRQEFLSPGLEADVAEFIHRLDVCRGANGSLVN